MSRPARHLLFVCSRNRLRSPTAAEVLAGPGIETDSAGLSPDAEVALTAEHLDWADLILVMEKVHLSRLNRSFGRHLKGKKVVVLGIPDDFDFMEPALVALLRTRCAPYLS